MGEGVREEKRREEMNKEEKKNLFMRFIKPILIFGFFTVMSLSEL